MSYVEILILRRLRSGPAHGYELRKRVEQTTGVVLHNNSLYPALRRFEEAGAVTKTAEPQQGRPPRLVYTLTEVGQELLHDMLADLPAEQAADPSEFLARLGQFDRRELLRRAHAVHPITAVPERVRCDPRRGARCIGADARARRRLLRSIRPNGPGCLPRAPGPYATSWRITGRCWIWRWLTASGGVRWPPAS